MAQIVVRKLSDETKDKLRRRARTHGRSMEEEARLILDAALSDPGDASGEYGWASRFVEARRANFTDDEADALELRGQHIRAAEFE